MGILCLFIGGTLMWVAAHGTSATSPWTLFQQIVAGWNGQAATAAPAAADAQPDGTAINAGDQASSSGDDRGDPTQDPRIKKILSTPDTTASDQANLAATRQRLNHIGDELNGGPLG